MSAADDKQVGPNAEPRGEDLTQLRNQLESLFQQGQWQAVQILSDRILGEWPGLADVTLMNFKARQAVELEQELAKRLEKSQQSGLMADWQSSWQSAQTLAQLSPANPGYRKILEQAEQNIVWSTLVSRAEALLQAGHWKDAADILAQVPEDLPSAASVRAGIDKKHKEIERQLSKHLESAEVAYQAGDLDGAIALLDQGLKHRPDDPNLSNRRQSWLEERDWRTKVDEARHAYNLDRLLELLELRPSHPQAGPLRAWAEQEGERRRQALLAISAYDAETVQDLISGMPEHHPDLPQLQRWFENETTRREQLRQARERSDHGQVMEILSKVTVNYPGYQELTDWVARESEQTFSAAPASESATAVHAAGPAEPPGKPTTERKPAESEFQDTVIEQPVREDETISEGASPFQDTLYEGQAPAPYKRDTGEQLRLAQESFAAQDWRVALQHLEEISGDHPEARKLRAEARQRWITQLYEQAHTAEANHDWEAATVAWLNLQVLQVDDPQIARRLEAIPRETNYAQLLGQAGSALKAGKWKQAIQSADQASRVFPERMEPHKLLSTAQVGAANQGRRRLVFLLAGSFGLFIILGVALVWTAVSAGWLPVVFGRTATPTAAPATATETTAPPSATPTVEDTPMPVLAASVTLTPSPSPTIELTSTPTAALTATPSATFKPLPPTPVPTATKKKEPKPPPEETQPHPTDVPPTDEPPPTDPPGGSTPPP